MMTSLSRSAPSRIFIKGRSIPVIRGARGRKRKTTAPRHPGGKVIQFPKQDYRALAALQPVRCDLPAKDRLSEKATTVLGRLALWGRISEVQYQAGERYRKDTQAYLQTIDCPPVNPPSVAGAFEPKRGQPDLANEELVRVRNRYMRAFEAANVTHRAARAVTAVVVHGQPCPTGWFEYLLCGLDGLVHHYGLTAGRKSGLPK